MERVIVNLRLANETTGRDLEIPAETPWAELMPLLIKALKWQEDVDYEVFADPPGRKLKPNESLVDAGAWDGATLVVHPLARRGLPEQPSRHTATMLVSEAEQAYQIPARAILGRASQGQPSGEVTIDLTRERDGKTVSRRHALIELKNDTWSITPLHGSTNRTLLNEVEIEPNQPHSLVHNDVVVLGDLALRFLTKGIAGNTSSDSTLIAGS